MPAPAAFRMTMIFQYISGASVGGYLNLKGGWSESFYSTSNLPLTLTYFQQTAQLRAALLPASAYISGLRIQGVDPSGGAQTFPVNYPGSGTTTTNEQDIPQMALLLRVRTSGTNNVRSWRLAAIPDAQMSNGEYRPGTFFGLAMSTFLLGLNGWKIRCQDLSQPLYNLNTIDAAGNVVVNSPTTLALNQFVKVKRTIDAFQNAKGLKAQIISFTDNQHFRIAPWLYGACTLGQIQQFVIIYPAIQTDVNTISRAVVRKIGRPSLAYRGRRSKRRP